MSEFKSIFDQAFDDIFVTFSEQAIYNGSALVSVDIQLDVEQFGSFDTTTPARRHEVTFRVSEIPNPKRGHTLKTAAGLFTLDGSISNDGSIARWHINAD